MERAPCLLRILRDARLRRAPQDEVTWGSGLFRRLRHPLAAHRGILGDCPRAARVELGPKDVAKQSAVLARRDRPGKEGKISASLADLTQNIQRLLVEIQQSMHDKALAFRRANTHEAKTYDELKKAVETGFALSHWCGSADCEATIKEETRATMRCIPLEQTGGSGSCVCCGQPASERAIFARAY